jgi:hypothetical protein
MEFVNFGLYRKPYLNKNNYKIGVIIMNKPEDSIWLAEFVKNIENSLPEAEQMYADAMMAIVAKYGKLSDRDGNGIWVGYTPAAENDNVDIGVKCSNCYFYESENVCKIAAGEIEPNGLCRLAAIPDGVVDMTKRGMR